MKSDGRRDGAERLWRGQTRSHLQTIEGTAFDVDNEAISLGARLSELLAEETPEDLLRRLQAFKRSVEDSLSRSSSAFQILRQLEGSGLKDCARCTKELEERLANNPHFNVLRKLDEAEQLLAQFSRPVRQRA